MRQALQEGLSLIEQMAALPFKAARQLLGEADAGQRPWNDVVKESLQIGEGLARLPFKATAVLLSEAGRSESTLEQRVAELERRLGVEPPQPPESPG